MQLRLAESARIARLERENDVMRHGLALQQSNQKNTLQPPALAVALAPPLQPPVAMGSDGGLPWRRRRLPAGTNEAITWQRDA